MRAGRVELQETALFGFTPWPCFAYRDLTALASAPSAQGQPSAFFDGGGFNIVIYRSGNGHIRSLYWTTGDVSPEDLSGFAGTVGRERPLCLDGRRIAFAIRAKDGSEVIGVGTHERMVIDIVKFTERLKAKFGL
jgi:hypothetical protein